MNQIIKVPDIAVVKTIGSNKQLFSLRDQKFKKNALQNFSTGSGMVHSGNLYVLDQGYYSINFQGDLLDSLGSLPVKNEGITVEENCITFTYSNPAAYLKYDIGKILSKGEVVTITLDVRLNRTNLRADIVSNRAPIFKFDGDTLYTDPLNMFTVWVLGQAEPAGENKETIYVCGIPDDPNGANPYIAYPLNEWHTLKLIWHYDTKEIYVFKDGQVYSKRWPFTTRPEYDKRPTKIQFGWNSVQAKCYCSIRNFKMTVE